MRYNHFQKLCVLFLIGAMLISVLPVQVIAESISASTEEGGQASSQESQTQGTETENSDVMADDSSTDERYYLDNGLVLELNEDRKSLTVVELVNVAATSIQIPDTYADLPVTRIGDLAFKGKTALTEVVLSDNIQHIGDDVFSGCDYLQCLEEDGARYVGSATNAHFYLLGAVNQDITACTVSAETKIVASYAFYNCKKLTEIVIPDSVIQVGFRALRGCDSLQSVTLPFAGETENGSENTHVGFVFGARTYGGNISFVPTTLTSLVIKRGMLQKNALYGLDSVQHLGLPSMQQPLGYYYGGETYEDNIDFIPPALTSVEIFYGNIPECAFFNSVKLSSISIPDSTTSIGKNAFLGCNSLTAVHITDLIRWCEIKFADGYSNPVGYAKKLYLNGELVTKVHFPEGTTAIGAHVFRNCTSLTAVTIPDGVLSIGRMAFYGCSGLTEMTLPDSVTEIGDYAFYGCSGLTKITLSDSITGIGGSTFFGCGGLTSVTIPDGVTSIGSSAFDGCTGLTSITIPESVTSIGSYAFDGCAGLTSITIPKGVTSIGNGAFSGCAGLTSITIPEGVTSIKGYVFRGCTGLTSITIPENVTSIEDYAFDDCTGLKEIYFNATAMNDLSSNDYVFQDAGSNSGGVTVIVGANVTRIPAYLFHDYSSTTYPKIAKVVFEEGSVCTSIGQYAFSGCAGLTSITISENVTSIEPNAFYSCDGLTDITIPESVTSIGKRAFSYCEALTTITYLGTYEQWQAISLEDGWNYNTGKYTVVCSDATVTKGGTVTELMEATSCSAARGEARTTIRRTSAKMAAQWGYKLAAAAAPTYSVGLSYTSNGDGTCYVSGMGTCTDTDLVIPSVSPDGDSVIGIAGNAFNGCAGLTSITIPESVTSIGSYAFYDCTGLKEIHFNATAMNDLSSIDYVFRNAGSNSGGVTVTIGANVTRIPAYLFYDYSSTAYPRVAKVVFEEGSTCTSIGSWAFNGCAGLTSITIPERVTSIEDYAFDDCIGLKEIHFNAIAMNDLSSNDHVFKNAGSNSGGVTVTVGANVSRIPAYLFYDYSSTTYPKIAKVVFEEGSVCTSIGSRVFSGCAGLTSITIPENVTSIGGGAFDGCAELTSITIPESVTSIENYAFDDCTGLKEIHFNATAMNDLSSNAYAFRNAGSDSGGVTVTIGAKVTRIPAYLFDAYSSTAYPRVAKVVFEEGSVCTVIGSWAFNGCAGLTSITIPENVTSIGSYVFGSCVGLKEIHFNAAAINDLSSSTYAFRDAGSNTDGVAVTIGANVTRIPAYLFYGVAKISAVVFTANGVCDSIGDHAFDGCTGIAGSLTIPKSVVSIGAYAFCRCGLTKVIFAQGSAISAIGNQAFAKTAIGGVAGAIEYPDNELAWRFVQKATDWDGGLTTWESSFVFTGEVTILYEMSDDRSEFYVGEYIGSGETANIPELFSGRPVTQLYEKAFFNAEGLKKVVIPNTIQRIFSSTFYNCPDLAEIVINGSDITMEQGIIFGCEALVCVTLPFLGRSATDTEDAYLGYLFGANSYKNNAIYVPMSLKKVIITDSTFIGDYAFKDCKYLDGIILPDNVETIGSHTFSGCESLSGEWVLPTSLERIGAYAFAGCNSLGLIVLPEGMTEIGGYAFSGCISLRELAIPDSVTIIGEEILDGCNNVKTIKIGSGIQEIPDVAVGYALFGIDKHLSSLTSYVVSQDNTKFATDERGVLYELHDSLAVPVAVLDAPAKADLKDYQLPEHIVYIGPYAFAYNTTLRWIQLDRVRRIDKCAFMEATSLVAAVFGSEDGLDAEASQHAEEYDDYLAQKGESYSQLIGEQAFFGCSMLRYVNLWTDFIVSIGQEAFYDCNMLSSVRLSASVQSIGQRAFGKTALESITVDEKNTHYASIDGVLYEKLEDGSYKLLLFPACKTVAEAVGKVYQTSFRLPEEIAVSAVESYAFKDAQYLKNVTLDSTVDMLVGDYAFQNAAVQTVYIGEKVTSLGLIRGEGEYTVFESCEYLTAVDVAQGNAYYSSEGGVLFDKEQTKLIKYPYHKVGGAYTLPDTVSVIASMAFKGNKNLTNIVIPSYIHTVGLEAFYDCSNLVSIYFDHVYAPVAVLENAFTTNTAAGASTRALLCYSGGYYENSSKGGFGWKNYKGIYPLYESNVIPDVDPEQSKNLFYAVVVVDSSGVPVDDAKVSLTDYNGKTEVIIAADGVAMFYDNLGDTQTDVFSIGFEDAYTIMVEDPSGTYYTFTNPALMLDEDMLITYITLTKLPIAYGVSCNGEDINSQRLELNKANIDFTDVLLDENGNIQYGADGKTPLFDEVVEISVIGYCDARYAFEDDSCGLYQNGVRIASVSRTEQEDGATIFYFRPAVADLVNDVDVEVRLTAVSEAGDKLSCSTVLNIHVFDFFIDESQLNLDQASANIDLEPAGDFAQMLLGGDGLELSLGKNIKLTTSLEDDIVTFQLEGSKELLKKKKRLIDDYERGFNENNQQGMKTYRFQYTAIIKDGDFNGNKLRYNISFTRETEDSDFYYYRCKVHDIGKGTRATDSNLITTFYGVVNRLDMAGRDARAAAKLKADLIFATHYSYVLAEGMDEDAVKAGANAARYSEPVVQLPDSNQTVTTQKLEISVTGEISFQYIDQTKFHCTGGSVKGNLVYQFNHNQQMMIWVIPVILRVEVKADGEIAITVEVDENQEVDLEMLLTLELDVTASIGVGCSVASVGFYGNIGTVFVLEILPEFGVDSWKIYGEMGAYARVLWFEYKYRFTPKSWADGYYIVAPTEATSSEEAVLSESACMASLYLADAYSGTDAQDLQTAYRLVVMDGELYKLCYADVSGMENYDANNYVKLALSKWEGEDWSQPVIIDDNGLNDAEYVLYHSGGKLMMAYTQQTQKLTDADDTYAAAQNLQIKVVELSGGMSKPVTVAKPDSYAYLTRYGVVDGVPTVVWAENADNNIFGVSPYNYIDNSGNSHVFDTTANSVWVSQYVNDMWTAPQCLAKNLSAVTQITISDAGDVAYIVDTNGDLTDTTDRVLYYGPVGGEMLALNDTAQGSVKSVIADGNRFLYHYDWVSPEETDGWMSLTTDSVAFPQDAPEEFELLYDGEGSLFAILYSENKTWTQSGEKKSGSAIYGRFLENGIWGNAVELSAYVPEHERYVQKFTAVLVGEEILISASTVDSAGENAFYTSGSCQLGAKLSVEVSEVDYAGQQVIFTVKNQGTASTDVYMSIGNGEYILISQSALVSGASMQYAVSQSEAVSFALTQSGDGAVAAESVSLAYSDLQTNAKQVLLGANDFLLFSVRNMGNTANTGITVIRNGDYDATTVASDAVYKAVMARNLKVGEITAFTFVNEKGEIETAWAVKNLVEPGGVFYHELAMSELVGNGAVPLVCLYTIPVTQLEPQSMEENNYVCLNYGVCDGVLQAGEEASTQAVLGINAMEFPKDAAEDLTIPFFCPQDTTVEQVRIGDVTLDTGAYTVEKLTVGGRILIPSSALADMSGSHTVTVIFTSGELCQMTLKLLSRYTVVWMDNGKILQEQLLEGTVPEFTTEMVKASDDAWTYTFAGWDYTGDGVADTLTAIAGDVAYWAVWNKAPRAYMVQWSMLGSAGEEILVTETYLYGDIPSYLGTVFVPDGAKFAGWQGGILPVTGDAVYTAAYESEESLVTPTLTLNYPSLSFEDEILYNVYYTLDDASSIVEMGLITFTERLANGTIADAVDVIPGFVNSGSTYMVQSNGIPAKNLSDAVYFKVYAKLTDGSYVYTDVAGYHAVAYANTVLNSSSAPKAKALVVAMLNYGAAAQVYFGYKTDALMNASLTAEQQALVSAYDSSMVQDIVKADASKVGSFVMNGGYSNIFPTVSFEGAFSINFYFTPSKAVSAAPVMYYWDSATYNSVSELTAENATGVLTMAQDGDNWGAAVEGIAAKAIDETVYVAGIYTSNGISYPTGVIAYSLGNYCKTIAGKGNAFGAATAVYGYYAKAYFN